MIEEILKNLYKIEIPLPNNPLKALNAYLIKGEDECLLVDTGFNRPESKEALLLGLQELNVAIEKTKVIITHLHADHSGLAEILYRRGATLYMEPREGERIRNLSDPENWEKMKEDLKTFGLDVKEDFFEDHPGKVYAPKGNFDYHSLEEGDRFEVGGYGFDVISVPGHTPNMINLFDREKGIYLSADHVLDSITPNIGFWGYDQEKMLEKYLRNLEKILDYPIKLMLPSHRGVMTEPKKRIKELIEHHRTRLGEVERIVKRNNQPLSVVDVAKEMHWRIRAKSWGAFPSPQKSFAAGEAMTHLEYLKDHGRIDSFWDNQIIYFQNNA